MSLNTRSLNQLTSNDESHPQVYLAIELASEKQGGTSATHARGCTPPRLVRQPARMCDGWQRPLARRAVWRCGPGLRRGAGGELGQCLGLCASIQRLVAVPRRPRGSVC